MRSASPRLSMHRKGCAGCLRGCPARIRSAWDSPPAGAALMRSGRLFGVRSLRPATPLSAPDGSASRELHCIQYPSLRLSSRRFVPASRGLTAAFPVPSCRPGGCGVRPAGTSTLPPSLLSSPPAHAVAVGRLQPLRVFRTCLCAPAPIRPGAPYSK